MSQRLLPDRNISVDDWSPSDVFPRVNELVASDESYVSSEVGVTSQFTVGLSPAAAIGRGEHVLKIRLARSSDPPDETVPVRVVLRKGELPIALWTINVAAATPFTTHSLTLSTAQIAAIGSEYGDLRVQVNSDGGGGGIAVCNCIVPQTLHVTVTAPGCGELDGLTFEAVYNSVTELWESFPGRFCGEVFSFGLGCVGSTISQFALSFGSIFCAPGHEWSLIDSSSVPFQLVYQRPTFGSGCPCCHDLTVTTTITA